MSSFDQMVEDLVQASLIKNKKEKENLRKELFAHVYSQKRELELQGYNEEKILITIQNNFGNIQTIGKELFFVHSMNKTLVTELIIMGFIILIMVVLLFGGFAAILFEPII